MSVIKNIDAGLMSFMTELRFPKRFNSPSSRFLFAIVFYLLMAGLFAIPSLIRGKVDAFTYIAVAVYLAAIFYHWRLWRKLRTKH